MWKGFTNQVSSPEASPSGSEEALSDHLSDDGNHTETPSSFEPSDVTSRLATTVWQGLMNQSAMEAPPSPVGTSIINTSRPSSPPQITDHQTSTKRDDVNSQHVPSQMSYLWNYAEKLKDSDAVATISKISSNWRAKALMGSWRGTKHPPQVSASSESSRSEPAGDGHIFKPRGGSLPPLDRSDVYSPPTRPLYFHSPRDSFILAGNPTLSPTGIPESPALDASYKNENIQTSFASLHSSRSAPRPLLLSPSTPITSPLGRHIPQSSRSTPSSGVGEWAHVMRANGQIFHRGSQSSVSSLSPSDAFNWPLKSGQSGWDSDTSSRRVPLNRKSVSPMAPGFRTYQGRPTSASLRPSGSGSGLSSPPLSTRSTEQGSLNFAQGWDQVDIPIFPTLTSPDPKTHIKIQSQDNIVRSEEQRPVTSSDTRFIDSSRKKVVRRTPSPSQYQQGDTSDSAVETPARSQRLRSKRHSARPPNLSIQDHISRSRLAVERNLSNSNSLAVEWPAEDQDVVPTPRASNFDVDELSYSSPVSSRSRRTRKLSTDAQERKISEGHDIRMRKVSTGQRMRKTSGDSKDVGKRTRDSSAEEGDDEGYDELLSAYESEEGLQISSRR